MPDIFIAEDQEELVEEEPTKKKKKKERKKEIKEKILKTGDELRALRQKRSLQQNLLSAFIYYPRNADFLNKDPEEEVVLILRKHPVTNLGWILISGLMLFAPGVLNFFPILDFLPERFKFIAVVSWYLLTVAFAFEHFLSWFFNVNIVTDERVFDVDFVNLTYREMTDANIDQIQDVTVKMGSVVRTLFNYGDVMIQTAAEIPQIGFEAVPQPDRVARILRELRVEEEQEKIEGRVR